MEKGSLYLITQLLPPPNTLFPKILKSEIQAWNQTYSHPPSKIANFSLSHFLSFFLFFFFWSHHAACWILVPQPGDEPVPPAVEVRSPNHWTTREFPNFSFFVFPKVDVTEETYACQLLLP